MDLCVVFSDSFFYQRVTTLLVKRSNLDSESKPLLLNVLICKPLDGGSFCVTPCSSLGLKWTMKLWDSLTTCLFLLSSVHTSPRTQPRRPPPSTSDPPERPLETPPVKIRLSINQAANTRVSTDRDDLERMADTEQSKRLLVFPSGVILL